MEGLGFGVVRLISRYFFRRCVANFLVTSPPPHRCHHRTVTATARPHRPRPPLTAPQMSNSPDDRHGHRSAGGHPDDHHGHRAPGPFQPSSTEASKTATNQPPSPNLPRAILVVILGPSHHRSKQNVSSNFVAFPAQKQQNGC